MSAGKGDKPRPVNKKQFDTNFDKIIWNKKSITSTSSLSRNNGKKRHLYIQNE